MSQSLRDMQRQADHSQVMGHGQAQPLENLDVEVALLGAILRNNKTYEPVSAFLRPEHFAVLEHSLIFEQIQKRIEKGQQVSAASLKLFADTCPELKAIGGYDYLLSLVANVVTMINNAYYGRTIHDLFLRRQFAKLGDSIIAMTQNFDDVEDVTSILDFASKELSELSGDTIEGEGPSTFAEVIDTSLALAEAAYKHDGSLSGLSTGLQDLDGILGGLEPDQLIVLGARPGMGKTALAKLFASVNAGRGPDQLAGLFFSQEMSKGQLGQRWLSEATRIPASQIRSGKYSKSTRFEDLIMKGRGLRDLNIFVDDTPGLTMQMMRARAKHIKRKNKLGLVVIDYLQLVTPSKEVSRKNSRVEEVSEISRAAKIMSKELGVPVVLLSQLSRKVEEREDKRPLLSDLRESGSIEQDADVVLFLYREEYYLEKEEPKERKAKETAEKFELRYLDWRDRMNMAQNKAEIIVAKQRQGPTGTATVFFEPETMRFADLHSHDEQGGLL